jgi:hypothetical protein
MKVAAGVLAIICGLALAASAVFGFKPDVTVVAGIGIIAAAVCALS